MTDETVEAGETLPPSLLEDQLQAYFSRNKLAVPILNVVGAGKKEDRIENVKSALSRGLPSLKKADKKIEALTIVAYGPSLKNSLPAIREAASHGAPIMTVSGAHDYLIDNGIMPDYHAEMDLRERKAEFVKNAKDEIHYLIASVCHPKMFETLEGKNVSMWHLFELEETNDIIRKKDPSGLFHPSFQCIGLNAIILGQTIGYREFHIHGMDSSYSDGESHADFHNGTNNDNRRIKVWCGDKQFETRTEWIQYARNFMAMVKNMTGCSFRVYGEGLLQQMLRVGLKEAA